MPNPDWTVRILAALAGVGQAGVGIFIVLTTVTAYRKNHAAHRLADRENVVSGVVYGSGRIALGAGCLSITVWPLQIWLLIGGFLLMFAGPFFARRAVRRFWHPSASIEGTLSSP